MWCSFSLSGRHCLMKDFLLLFLLNSVKDKAGYLLNGYSHNYIISVFMKQSDTFLTFHNFFSSSFFFFWGGGVYSYCYSIICLTCIKLTYCI